MKPIFNLLSQSIYTLQLAYHAVAPTSMTRCLAAAGCIAGAGGSVLAYTAARSIPIDYGTDVQMMAGALMALAITEAVNHWEKENRSFVTGTAIGALAYLAICAFLPEVGIGMSNPAFFDAAMGPSPVLLYR